MIEQICELTPDQEARMPEFKEKWTKINLSTAECDRDQAKYWMDEAYRLAGYEPVNEIHWVRSPKEGLDLAKDMMLSANNDNRDYIDELIHGYNYGCHEASYLSFYEFFYVVCGFDILKPLVPQFNIAPHSGWWIPFDTCIIACAKPTSIHVVGDVLHKDLVPAVNHADGFDVYILNGIYMPDNIVITPANELDSQLILSEGNVDVRREIIRKIGYDKMYEDLGGETIETVSMTDLYKKHSILSYEQQGDVIFKPDNLEEVKYKNLKDDFKKSLEGKSYSLVNMRFGDGSKPFLVMDNMSIGAKHVEGVPPNITNVFDAICFRNQMKGLPQELK